MADMADPQAAGLRVLIVEDEFLIRMTLVEALTDEGYEITEAATGDEALAAIGADPLIGLLLTDINLPGSLDGIALARCARARRPDLAVIYMTGRPDSMTAEIASERELFIGKPYLPSEVIAAVRRLTARAPG